MNCGHLYPFLGKYRMFCLGLGIWGIQKDFLEKVLFGP